MKIIISILAVFILLSVGCAKRVDVIKIMYVSSTEYEKISCKQLREKFNDQRTSCKELKESLVYIYPTEYEKLSCKQLNEELIKINERLHSKSRVKVDRAVGRSWLFMQDVYYLGLPLLTESDEDRAKYIPPIHEQEIKRLKKSYKVLKDTAMKKNCSFAADIPDLKID